MIIAKYGGEQMNYILHYDIAALIIYLPILLVFYGKKGGLAFKSRIFECLIWSGFLSTVSDIGSTLVNTYDVPMMAKWTINMLYYLCHSSTSFLVASYFVVMAEPIVKMSLRRKCQLVIPFSIQAVLIAFNPMLKVLFYFDANGSYHRGKYILVGYAIAMYYLVYLLIFVLKHTDFFDKSTRIVIYASTLFNLVPLAIQIRVPYVLIECFGVTLYILIINMVFQANDASVDNATKLLSRQSFESDCKAYTSLGSNFSVLVVKLRDAEFIQKRLGPQVWGKMHLAFANYISRFVRYGNAYSLGNGSFVLCFVNESSEPKYVIDNISGRMKEQWGFDGMKTMLSATMCLVSYPLHAPDCHTFLDLVDEVVARKDEKDTIVYVDSIEVVDRRRRSTIERTLNSETLYRALEVVYQPIYSIRQKRYTHAEALIRLRDPILGYIMPEEFIPIAERSGRMSKLGQFVLENVCKLIASEKPEGAGLELIGVNLSVIQCMQTDLVSQIASVVQKYDISPSSICFEITENVGANPPDIVINNVRELNSLGFRFAIDDFGTASVSMQQIMVLPIRYLKLDRSFIEEAFTSEKTMLLLRNSIDIAKSIHLEVIAEGIETKELAKQVADHFDVDYCQGFYYSESCMGRELSSRIKSINAKNMEI